MCFPCCHQPVSMGASRRIKKPWHEHTLCSFPAGQLSLSWKKSIGQLCSCYSIAKSMILCLIWLSNSLYYSQIALKFIDLAMI